MIRKLRLSVEIHDVTTWFTNNSNTYIGQYLNVKATRGEIWSINRNNKRNISLQKVCQKWGRETSSRTPFIFWKSLIWGKSKWSAAYFWHILIALNLPYNKTKQCKTLDYWSRDLLSFSFSEKSLGLVSPPHFAYYLSRKMFLMLHSINWPNFIVWLSLLLEILGNMRITIVC